MKPSLKRLCPDLGGISREEGLWWEEPGSETGRQSSRLWSESACSWEFGALSAPTIRTALSGRGKGPGEEKVEREEVRFEN